MNTLAERLKFIRKKRQLTQQELSKKSGASQQIISGIESGKVETTNEIFNLAEALEVEPKWLATGKGNMNLPKHSAEDKKILASLNELTLDQKQKFIQEIEEQKRQNELIIQELSGLN